MPKKYSKKLLKKEFLKEKFLKEKFLKEKFLKEKQNAIPNNEVQFMKELINNNKSSIPSYTPLNNDNNYTPTMPATLSAVDTNYA